MNVTVRVNDRELKRELSKLAKRANDKQVEKALVAGALLIQNRAKQLARFREGNLRRSIHVGGHTNRTGIAGRKSGFDKGSNEYSDIGGNGPQGGEVSVLIGTNLVYARIHEFGGKTGRNHAATITPKPYLRPAFNQEWRNALRKTRDVLKRLVINR